MSSMRCSEPRPVLTLSLTCFMKSLLTRAIADLGSRQVYASRHLLRLDSRRTRSHSREAAGVIANACQAYARTGRATERLYTEAGVSPGGTSEPHHRLRYFSLTCSATEWHCYSRPSRPQYR